jgi:uncharacterized protein (DUF1778 family)
VAGLLYLTYAPRSRKSVTREPDQHQRLEPTPNAQHDGRILQPSKHRCMDKWHTILSLATQYAKGSLMAHPQEPVTISIRAKAGQRDLIDQAAERLGRSRSDFMLEAACRQAEDVLLDQTYFALDAKGFAAFQALLDKPPAPTDRLRRTLKAHAPWAATAPASTASGKRAK